MNDNAELYHKGNNLQRNAAIQCLEAYGPKMKWKKSGDRVIDIGCADGFVTNIIKKYMPNNFERLVGCDIHAAMVKFANNHFRNDRTSFTQLDIEADLPDDMKGSFDHVFSFLTIHWIPNQEKAFKNVYDLLSDDGDCLLTVLGHTPLYTAYTVLSETEKWSKWVTNLDQFVSPYHVYDEPDTYLTKVLKKIGFKQYDVRCKQKQYKYHSVQELKDAISAVNPYKMPKEVFDEFFEDYIQVVRDLKLFDQTNNNSHTITLHYNLLVIYASKS
ncbi:hypothetical protein O3G_MSEX003895 [Manduca sexta]|uniref:Methyltransferase domain-containing protein n=1 Tax=Manduca sexta TaxID=7130 RepID=A0A921YTZ4_MANSE|nr:hypothetical protein O3G_MSEX003895 [Manduca sexta]